MHKCSDLETRAWKGSADALHPPQPLQGWPWWLLCWMCMLHAYTAASAELHESGTILQAT